MSHLWWYEEPDFLVSANNLIGYIRTQDQRFYSLLLTSKYSINLENSWLETSPLLDKLKMC